MIIIGNGRLITRNAAEPYYENGAVVTENELIKETGTTAEMRLKYPDAEFVDAKGGVIMPAFINAHTHIYSALARGLSIAGYNPANFYEVLDGMWWKIDRSLTLEDTRRSAYTTIIDCIKTGCTTIFDHHASFCQIEGSLFAIADAAKALGIRACLCYEVSERDGEKKCDESIEENKSFIDHCERENDPMLKAMFGGHALFTIGDKTFEKCVKANGGRTGFHIHVCEGMNDVYDSMKNYGCRSVNRLLYNGILGERTLLGHCIHISPAEMDIIRETGTMVVNNPESNMGNAVGAAKITELAAAGITLGLGTDGYVCDMLQSYKMGSALCKHASRHPNKGWDELPAMLFENNAVIAERAFPVRLGKLKEGYAADVIVLDYNAPTELSDKNINGHLLFGASARSVVTTIAGGRLLMKDRRLTELDADELFAKARECAKELWKRL